MEERKFKVLYLFIGLVATVASAVKIRELKVPPTYILHPNDPGPPPIHLDCMYDLGAAESGFVLKWLLDGNPVYQWIPPKRPTAIGFFKARTDATFEMDGDTMGRFRSLRIVRPEFNMSGEYTCSVQTFQSSDTRSAKLQIIVPDKDFDLNYKNDDNGHVVIKCFTSGVFPKPKLTIMIDNGQPLSEETDGSGQSNDGLYDAIVGVRVPKDSLNSPTAINCVLTIPGTNYTKKRETIYYDTVPSTMSPDGDEGSISRLAIYGKSGATASRIIPVTPRTILSPCCWWSYRSIFCTVIGLLLLTW